MTTEAPVTDDTTTDVATEAFTDEATPEVATEETVAPATTAEVNTDNYTSNFKLTMNDAGWGSPVTFSGELKDQKGAVVSTTVDGEEKQRITASYVWLVDGRQANGQNASGNINDAVATAVNATNIGSYTPSVDDFNKTLSVMVTVKRGNTPIYQETVVGGVVGAKDISAELTGTLQGIVPTPEYNGKEQKQTPTNGYTVANGKITNKHITWNYSTEGNDFTNVTGKTITVTGTLEGTYEASSDAYGYKGHVIICDKIIQSL